MLQQDNYLFYLDVERNATSYWKCIYFESKQCLGRAITKDENFVRHRHQHNHVPDRTTVEVKSVMEKIYQTSKDHVEMAPRTTIATSTAGTSDAVHAHLPSLGAMTKAAQRVRHREMAPLANPATRAELHIVPPYDKTSNG